MAEYVVLLACIGIAIPTLAVLGRKIPELFEEPPGLEQPDTPVVIGIPDCAMTGLCELPPEVKEECLETTAEGEECSLAPVIVLPPYLIPIVADPQIQWAVTLANEDYLPVVFANSPSDTASNQHALATHPYDHPAALYCQSKGGMLPSIDLLARMANHQSELRLVSGIYLSSSQFWDAGGWNPPPVLEPLNYVQAFDYFDFNRSANPIRNAFTTDSFYVRCVQEG